MGKCVSKQPVAGLNEFGSSPYLAICNEDDIIYINVVSETFFSRYLSSHSLSLAVSEPIFKVTTIQSISTPLSIDY